MYISLGFSLVNINLRKFVSRQFAETNGHLSLTPYYESIKARDTSVAHFGIIFTEGLFILSIFLTVIHALKKKNHKSDFEPCECEVSIYMQPSVQ